MEGKATAGGLGDACVQHTGIEGRNDFGSADPRLDLRLCLVLHLAILCDESARFDRLLRNRFLYITIDI